MHLSTAKFVYSRSLTQLSAPIAVGNRLLQVSCSPALHWLMRQYLPCHLLFCILILVCMGCILLLRYHMHVMERHVLMMKQRDQFLQFFSHEIKNPLQVKISDLDWGSVCLRFPIFSNHLLFLEVFVFSESDFLFSESDFYMSLSSRQNIICSF